MDDSTKITLATLILTSVVTIITGVIGYCQNKSNLKESRKTSLDVLKEERAQEHLQYSNQLTIEIIQEFAYVSGNILTSIESPIRSDEGRRISFSTLSKFDKCYYNIYILLSSKEDKNIFKNFQYKVRQLAGLPNPKGRTVDDEVGNYEEFQNLQSGGYLELPQPIYDDLEKCLEICNKLMTKILDV